MDLSNENSNEIEAEPHACQICDTVCNSENNLWYHITKFHTEPDDTDATQTIEIRLPTDSFITGRYVEKYKIGKDFKGIDTPDGSNVVHIESEAEFMRLKNPNDIDYSFTFTTIHRGKEVKLVRVKYESAERCLRIDNHWTISNQSIENRYRWIPAPARVQPNEWLKIELNEKHFEGLDPNLSSSNLVSIRFNDGPFCKIGFHRNKLSFVSYDE